MNCTNHPDTPSVNFCQNCGKPYCAQCIRSVNGMVYCEPCLAARLGVPPTGAQPGAVPAGYSPVAGSQSPVLAALLGFIPGVGAMYNGQFAKGLVHVIIFIALVSATHNFGLFGLLVFGWVCYQVFDAYQTAFALQRGLPLPDPLGLNNIGAKLGLGGTTPPPTSGTAPFVAPTAPPATPYAASAVPPTAGYPSAYPTAYPAQPFDPAAPLPPIPPVAPAWDPNAPPPGFDPSGHRSLPVGAIVLLALGVLFLLGTVGAINVHWISRGWPLILIGLGIWIFYRNNQKHSGGPQ
jgi:TM2 domain-containing membrane protein YozV